MSKEERKEWSTLKSHDYYHLIEKKYNRLKFLTLKEDILFDFQSRKEIGELVKVYRYDAKKISTIEYTLKRVISIDDLKTQRKS